MDSRETIGRPGRRTAAATGLMYQLNDPVSELRPMGAHKAWIEI